jgi:lambda family phage portal protein
MTVLDRIKRTLAQVSLIVRDGGFTGASGSPRWSPPPQMMTMPQRQVLADAARLAARANYRVANGASAEAIAAVWSTNLVGDGPSARSQHPNRAMRRGLEAAWRRFYARCDVDGFDLGGLMGRGVRSLVVAGEAVVLMQTTPRGELRLKLLSPEQLDRSRNEDTADGGRTDQGIKRNAFGEVTGYYLFAEHPASLASLTLPSVFVPADDVLHIFDPRWAGQTRGISWLTPVMALLHQLDRLIDALVERAQTCAMFSGWITDATGQGGGFTDSKIEPSELSMEPGVMRILPPGTSVTFPDLPGSEGMQDLMRQVLRQIGSGVGIPYELLSGDLSQTNYSSAKLGLGEFYRRCRAIRASLLQARCLDLIWQRVVTLEILSGRLQAPDFERDAESFFAVNWGWPAWPSLDPLKEVNADVAAINAGIKSRQQVVEEGGRDVEDVDSEIAADNFIPRTNATAGNAPANGVAP